MERAVFESVTPDLLVQSSQGVLTLSMNRPASRNAMTEPMVEEMARLLALAELDSNVRCVVLTGSGQAFCAGGDVKSMADAGDASTPERSTEELIRYQRAIQRATAGKLSTMAKPTLAVLPGAAAGAGLALALACDLRIMSDTAIMATAFAKVGYSGDFGGSFFLTKLVGTAKARELYFLAARLDAAKALSLGLTNWVVPSDQIDVQASEIAAQLAAGPPLAYAYMKENLNRALSGDLGECLDIETDHHIYCGLSQDHRMAVKALVEKRRATFVGR